MVEVNIPEVVAELTAEFAHLVLEQHAQRLDQFQLHGLGQAAHIVMRLDGDARAARRRHALDHVGVERALGEKVGVLDLLALLLEHLDEQPADDLAFSFRVAHAFKRAQEALARVDRDQRNVVVPAEQLDDLGRLVLAQQAVVHEDASQLIADRLVDQERGDRRVHAAG